MQLVDDGKNRGECKMNAQNNFFRRSRDTLTACSMLLLAACHQEFILRDANNAVVGQGSIETSVEYPSPVTAVVSGKQFSGTWRASKEYEPEMAKMHRHLSTRSYEEYMRGDSAHQLRHGTANLTAEDGTQLECDFYYRTEPESGDCSLDGNTLTIKFSDGIH